ncbi:MAG TPA: STAS domain-containing protein [Pyrinomonadaceae bacterium]|jgi:anti-anti-sigma factor|nr:STAS domain-containing protein [Pyrinomonadaceae bacterium]
MAESINSAPVRSRSIGEMAVVYATDYLNKLSGERIERECRRQFEQGCRALVINFRDTELVNSIGVSILLGVIDAAEGVGAHLVFSDVNLQTVELFEMLGLTKYVALAEDEQEALATLTEFTSETTTVGH